MGFENKHEYTPRFHRMGTSLAYNRKISCHLDSGYPRNLDFFDKLSKFDGKIYPDTRIRKKREILSAHDRKVKNWRFGEHYHPSRLWVPFKTHKAGFVGSGNYAGFDAASGEITRRYIKQNEDQSAESVRDFSQVKKIEAPRLSMFTAPDVKSQRKAKIAASQPRSRYKAETPPPPSKILKWRTRKSPKEIKDLDGLYHRKKTNLSYEDFRKKVLGLKAHRPFRRPSAADTLGLYRMTPAYGLGESTVSARVVIGSSCYVPKPCSLDERISTRRFRQSFVLADNPNLGDSN